MDNERILIAAVSSVEETKNLAGKLAAFLQPGDVILLSGDLGAGKTQFTQGLAAGLGANEAVISPTFNIVLTYGSGRLPLHHFDLYRLEDDGQLEDIALREYLESDGVCVIEWAEKFPTAYDEYLALYIEKTGDDERTINGFARGKRGEELLEHLKREFDADREGIWETEIFGKTLNELVREGMGGKLAHLPEEARGKLRDALEKIINEGGGGMICILL